MTKTKFKRAWPPKQRMISNLTDTKQNNCCRRRRRPRTTYSAINDVNNITDVEDRITLPTHGPLHTMREAVEKPKKKLIQNTNSNWCSHRRDRIEGTCARARQIPIFPRTHRLETIDEKWWALNKMNNRRSETNWILFFLGVACARTPNAMATKRRAKQNWFSIGFNLYCVFFMLNYYCCRRCCCCCCCRRSTFQLSSVHTASLLLTADARRAK